MINEFSRIIGVSVDQILGQSRVFEIVMARHLYFWLLYKNGYRMSEIGRMNDRNPATITNSIKVINNAITINDIYVTGKINRIKHLIQN